jgi:uncharacterized membrane protein
MASKSALVAAAVGGLMVMSAAASFAADAAPTTEKCYGVSKAGKNDCAGAAHACSGQSKSDASKKDFVNLPKGTCERLVGGSLMAGK